MPVNTRNFWATISADGVNSTLSRGPKAKDGGINVRLQVRDNGSISDDDVTINGRVSRDGTRLIVDVCHGNKTVYTFETTR